VTEQEIIEFLMDAGCIKVASIAPGDTTGTNCTYDFTEDGEMLRLTINGQMCPVYQLQFDETCQHLFAVDVVVDVEKRIVQHVVDLDTVQLREFTGQQDKNGKEAYQDDLVNLFDRSLYHIEWDENYARFQLRWISGQCELINIYDMSLIQYGEIVGNVYENANLLPEEQS
jgi:hypothetical protein